MALPAATQSVWRLIPDETDGKFANTLGVISSLIAFGGFAVAIYSFRKNAATNRAQVAEQNARTHLQQKKQHTITILFETRLSEQFQVANRKRRQVFPEYKDIAYDDWNAARRAKTVDFYGDKDAATKAQTMREGAESLQMMLNYYEFLAVGLRQDDLDEDLLKGTVRGIMCNLVDDSRLLISHLRKSDEKTFENLVWLYNRWRREGVTDVNGNPTERPIPD